MRLENIQYCVKTIGKICEDWLFKALVSLVVISFQFLFDPLQYQVMISIIVLLVIDFLTGVYASYRAGEPLVSYKIFRSALKTAAYFLLISAGYVSERAIGIHFIDETIMAFLAATELKSIIENISKAGFAVPQNLLKKLQDIKDNK